MSDLQDVMQARAMEVFNSMRAVAAENGYMSDEEIENEIADARRERRSEVFACRN